MHRKLRSLAIASTLALTAGVGLAFNAGVAHAAPADGAGGCIADAYVVPNSNSPAVVYTNGAEFYTYLMYSPSCQSNFAETLAYGTNNTAGVVFGDKIRRYAGPDGPYEMLHSDMYTVAPGQTLFITSPAIYSPDNAAQACFSIPSDDQLDCTGKV